MSLRTYAYVVVARATRRFAPTGLGVSRTPEDIQTDHHQKNRSGSCASPCPYRGCLCRHPGCLSSWLAALSIVHLDAFFSICSYHTATVDFVQILLGLSRRSRSYLRAAQAYILISMPTCTSKIFGVFQDIRDSQVSGSIAAVKSMVVTDGGRGRDAV
jgi:hypothetical protein